ncbi:uncharacterized protein LOC129252967 [Anastrepha obliqua]|uniref:uncharacterized protein LOC129252967 n=1 Tax=Anastrepha obliqua TaxID=95512 RepID=UPI002409DFAA|nr:uncharacterized protein LOC129252967 [Anastrepha obliqua]
MNETDPITDVTTYQLQKIRTQLEELKGPTAKRPKRSINWIGSAWKWIAGSPDALDWDEILRSQNEIIDNNNLQYKVNSEIFKKTEELLQVVNGIATATNDVLGRTHQAKFSQEIQHKLMILKDDVSELIRACQMAKAGVANSNLLNKEEINSLISEIEVLPYSNVVEAIEYSEPSIYTNGTLLLYVLSMPKVAQTRFNHLITRSILKDGHRVDLKYKTILINKQLTYGIKNSCLHLATAMVCKQEALDLLSEDECLPRLLKGGQTSCRYVIGTETTVEVLKEDTIFLDNFNSSIWSGKIPKHLSGSYILQMENETITINNQTYWRTSSSGVQVLPPVLSTITNRSLAVDLNLVHEMTSGNIRLLGYLKDKNNWFATSEALGLILLMVFILLIWRKLTTGAKLPELNMSILQSSSRNRPKNVTSPNHDLRDADL